MDRQTVVCLGILVLAAFLVGFNAWAIARPHSLLQDWVEQNGYTIREKERLYLPFTGPFAWTTGRGQVVFRVTVEDKQGDVHHGWIRCGNWWFGPLLDQVEAHWDD